MWKFVLVLLITATAILIAQLVADAPVIQAGVRRAKGRSRSPMPMQASAGNSPSQFCHLPA